MKHGIVNTKPRKGLVIPNNTGIYPLSSTPCEASGQLDPAGHPEFAAKLAPSVVKAAEMIATGRLHIPVAGTYPLSSIKEAVAHAQRGGKILLDVAGLST